MATEALISWNAPEHIHTEKNTDWYWAVGIISLSLTIVCFIFDSVVTGMFIIVASIALVIAASKTPKSVYHEINDRGIIVDKTLYPFLSLDSFWIPHDQYHPRIILKSRKLFMPYIVLYIDEIDPESIREVIQKYIAEKEHPDSITKHLFERFGF